MTELEFMATTFLLGLALGSVCGIGMLDLYHLVYKVQHKDKEVE